MPHIIPTPFRSRGFTLIEVVISVGIFAVVGMALISLFTLGLKESRQSTEELDATHVAESIFSTRRVAPYMDLSTNGFPLPALTNSNSTVSPLAPVYLSKSGLITNQSVARFGLVYTITPNTNVNMSHVYMCLYWPAQVAAPSNAQGRYETYSTFTLP